jgi:hypothetical protein
MILNNAINVGNFIYCMTYLSPNESGPYHNSGNGHYHQWVYVVSGSGKAELTDEENGPITLTKDVFWTGKIVDKSDTRDKYSRISTVEGLSMIFFNPIPDTLNLAVEIVHGPITKTITAEDKRITVVCITGPITVNDKTVESLQHAKIFPGKTAELNLSENTICALVQDK